MTEIAVAIGLVFVVEGLVYALAPGLLKRMMRQALEMSDDTLRIGGAVALALGVLIVWLAR